MTATYLGTPASTSAILSISMMNIRRRSSERKTITINIVAGFCVAALLAVLMFSVVVEQGQKRVSARARSDAGQIVEITSGFVRTYSAYGAKHANGNLPNPAIFRADALEHIERRERNGSSFTTGVVGLPGREIASVAKNDAVRNQLLALKSAPSLDVLDSVVQQEGRAIHRSFWAFYATEQACADCHNQIQNLSGDDRWNIGDLMGAQTVEKDITAPLIIVHRNAMDQSLSIDSGTQNYGYY